MKISPCFIILLLNNLQSSFVLCRKNVLHCQVLLAHAGTSAKVILGNECSNSSISLFKNLQMIRETIHQRTAVLTYKCLHILALKHLQNHTQHISTQPERPTVITFASINLSLKLENDAFRPCSSAATL